MADKELNARITLSFYRYVYLDEPEQWRLQLQDEWLPLGVLGRIYVSKEGINAQLSVPSHQFEAFRESVHNRFPDMPFKIALEEAAEAFVKLKIKVRAKLVADGLSDEAFDVSNVGNHLDAKAFHEAMKEPSTIVVDMRNHYECEVGHFEGALVPDANTFRDALPEVLDKLRGQEENKVLLYCTGGIRCEKASAWFKHHGFRDVNQLHGGIIDYVRQIREENLESKFLGKNFVFDQRMGERVTEDVIAHCHQCDVSCDQHTNCAYEGCNRLFIQCASCSEDYDGCCSRLCQDIAKLPKEERTAIQRDWDQKLGNKHYWSRTRVPEDFARQQADLHQPLRS